MLSNLTVVSYLDCAWHCLRKENCAGFMHRTQWKAGTMNCQLTNWTFQECSVDQDSDDSVWKFFLRVYNSPVSYITFYMSLHVFSLRGDESKLASNTGYQQHTAAIFLKNKESLENWKRLQV